MRVRRGVVLAAGGFPQDKERRRRMFPHDRDNKGHHSPAPQANTGDGLRLGEEAGAAVEKAYPNAAAWVPVSRVPRKDGAFGVFPHFIDRAKPGLIAVLPNGKRFVNEANSYHDFCQALFAARNPTSRRAPTWLSTMRSSRASASASSSRSRSRSDRTSAPAISRPAVRSANSPRSPESTRRV